MTLITKKLQEVYTDLLGLHKPAFILEKNYMALLLEKFIWKLWIFLLKSKDKFFDIFKL